MLTSHKHSDAKAARMNPRGGGNWGDSIAALFLFSSVCLLSWVPTEKAFAFLPAVALLQASAFGIHLVLGHNGANQKRSQVVLWILGCVWFIWGAIQWLPLPNHLIDVVAPHTNQTRLAFGAVGPAFSPNSTATNTLSIIAWHSKVQWSVQALAFSTLCLGAMLCTTVRVRLFLLVGIVTNQAAIALWGSIQRAFTSPMVASLDGDQPYRFANFASKNSAAAAMLLGTAATIGLIVWFMEKNLFRYSNSGTSNSGSRAFQTFSGTGYSLRGDWFDLRIVTLVSLLVLMTTGLFIAASRGAWVAGLFAWGMLGWLYFRQRSRKLLVGGAVFMSAATLGMVMLLNQQAAVTAQIDDLDLATLAADDRLNHWRDGWQLVMANPLSGWGAGNYGYALLAYQAADHPTWYRNAHNQFLESFAESGLLGLIIPLAAIWLIGRQYIVSLLRRSSSSNIAMGAMGTFLITSAAIQSTVDYVWVVPANLLPLSFLLAIALTETSESRTLRTVAGSKPISSFRMLPAVSIVLLLLPAYLFLKGEAQAQSALAATIPPSFTKMPTEADCEKAIRRLSSSALNGMENDAIHLRLSVWYSMAARLELLKLFPQSQQAARWQSTEPASLFAVSLRMTDEQKQTFAQRLDRWTETKHYWDLADQQLELARSINPLLPQAHYSLAFLAPLIDKPWQANLQRGERLASSNPEHLYVAGVMHLVAGDNSAAMAAWKRYLSVSETRIEQVYEAAIEAWGVTTTISAVLPPNADQMHRLLRQRKTSHKLTSEELAVWKQCYADKIDEVTATPLEQRLAAKARFSSLVGEAGKAVDYWAEAVRIAPQRPDLRVQYALQLAANGDAADATLQAQSAGALGASKTDLQRIENAIKRKLR